jgi:hypothetical protein
VFCVIRRNVRDDVAAAAVVVVGGVVVVDDDDEDVVLADCLDAADIIGTCK